MSTKTTFSFFVVLVCVFVFSSCAGRYEHVELIETLTNGLGKPWNIEKERDKVCFETLGYTRLIFRTDFVENKKQEQIEYSVLPLGSKKSEEQPSKIAKVPRLGPSDKSLVDFTVSRLGENEIPVLKSYTVESSSPLFYYVVKNTIGDLPTFSMLAEKYPDQVWKSSFKDKTDDIFFVSKFRVFLDDISRENEISLEVEDEKIVSIRVAFLNKTNFGKKQKQAKGRNVEIPEILDFSSLNTGYWWGFLSGKTDTFFERYAKRRKNWSVEKAKKYLYAEEAKRKEMAKIIDRFGLQLREEFSCSYVVISFGVWYRDYYAENGAYKFTTSLWNSYPFHTERISSFLIDFDKISPEKVKLPGQEHIPMTLEEAKSSPVRLYEHARCDGKIYIIVCKKFVLLFKGEKLKRLYYYFGERGGGNYGFDVLYF